MKWIGQHIWSFISRFRSDVYFESLENSATDTDKFLIIGSSGKLKYRTGTQLLSDIGGSSTDTLPTNTFGDAIKVLPSDFMSDDSGSNSSVNFSTTDRLGVMANNTNQKLFASISIPRSKKATHVDVYGNHADVFTVYELSINGGLSALPSGTAGNVGTTLDIPDIDSSEFNYVAIIVDQGDITNKIYGAKITIANI